MKTLFALILFSSVAFAQHGIYLNTSGGLLYLGAATDSENVSATAASDPAKIPWTDTTAGGARRWELPAYLLITAVKQGAYLSDTTKSPLKGDTLTTPTAANYVTPTMRLADQATIALKIPKSDTTANDPGYVTGTMRATDLLSIAAKVVLSDTSDHNPGWVTQTQHDTKVNKADSATMPGYVTLTNHNTKVNKADSATYPGYASLTKDAAKIPWTDTGSTNLVNQWQLAAKSPIAGSSSIVTLGTPTTISGQTAVGNGVPVIIYKLDSTAITAKNTSANTMVTPSNATHHWEVSAYLRCSTLGSSSTWTIQIGFTDGSAVTYNWPTAATTATGVFLFSPITIRTSNNTAITEKVVVTGTAPIVSYSVYLKMLD